MEYKQTSDLLNSELKNIVMRHSKSGIGHKTGYPDLDTALGGMGFEPSLLYIIGGVAGMGKTMTALNLLVNQLKSLAENEVLIYLSTGTSEAVLIQKILAIALGIELRKIQTGNLTQEELIKLKEDAFLKMLVQNGLVLIQDTKPALAELKSITAQLQKKGKIPKMLFIDTLQAMQTDGSINREQGISELMKDLRDFAVQINAPLVLTSEVSKRVLYRDIRVPKLEDLRDSRLIADRADFVFFVLRPLYYEIPGEDFENILEELHLVCQKNKYLPLDTLLFQTDLRKHLVLARHKYSVQKNEKIKL